MLDISWGVKEIDETIGKIKEGTLTLFYGPTGSAKTTLSTYIPIMRIITELGGVSENEKFVVVDGDGGFDIDRFKQILSNNGINFDDIKDNIIYFDTTEFSEQHNVITKEIPKMIKDNNYKLLLISVDPITATYRGIVMRTDMTHRMARIGEYGGKIDLQAVSVRRLAVEYKCPAFVTTWTASKVGRAFVKKDEEYTPPEMPFIGTRVLGFLPKTIAEIKVPNRYSPFRKLLLWKARGLPAGLTADFQLTNRGIEPLT